ncbi:MAG: MmgE/PrpD family protein [Chloroflexota bacterium]
MVTETVARFNVNMDYKALPQEAVRLARKHIMDCLGVALAGSVEPAVDIVAGYLNDIGGTAEATVVARKFKTSAPQAALLNGVIAHVLDYDDVSWTWNGHPSVAVLPAVLSLGEKKNASGKEIITAYLTGIEVGAKISLGLKGHYEAGWHATATLGTMAATAAAANLLRLDVRQTQMALGIAASMASGTRQNFGTMTKPLHAGKAAYNGVMAASLAQKGFTAEANILEAPMGFARLMGGGDDVERMAQNLGRPFDIIENGLTLKPYPCCRFAHRCIDAVLYLENKHRIIADDVAEVICQTSPLIPTFLLYSSPKTGAEAKFSMQYCMAVALLDREMGLQQFTETRVNRADVQTLMTKVRYNHAGKTTTKVGDAMTEPEEVLIKLRNGDELRQTVTLGKGEPDNPMSDLEVAAKFRDCARLVFTPRKQDRVLELLMKLESVERVSELMDTLAIADT